MTPKERWDLLNIEDFSLFNQADSMPRDLPPYENGIVYCRDCFAGPPGFTQGPTILVGAHRTWCEWRKQEKL